MLSQLNLRFHKKLIEALKTRAGRENTSVNALAERFLDDGLKTVAPGDGYFQLIADPEATVRQLYRHIILGQTFGTSALSRDECVFRSIRSRIGIEVRSAIRIHSINRELNFFYRFLTRFFAAFHYRGIFPQ